MIKFDHKNVFPKMLLQKSVLGPVWGALGGLGGAKMAPETGKIEKTRVQKKVQKKDMSGPSRTQNRCGPWGQTNQRKN